MLSTWLKDLHRLATATNAPFPVYDTTRACISEHGLAYYVLPRKRRLEDSLWFDGTLYAQQRRLAAVNAGLEPPHWNSEDVLLLIHWPHLLWTARPHSRSPMKPMAHRLLRALKPLILQYDAALVTMLERYETDWAKNVKEHQGDLGYFGQRDEADGEIFTAHLQSLLANKSFKQHLAATMRQSTRIVTADHVQHTLGRCPSGATHRKGQDCGACKDLRWVRANTSVLWPGKLNEVKSGMAELQFDKPDLWPEGITNPWLLELRHWVSLCSEQEGVARTEYPGYGEALLVDFGKLIETAKRYDREMPLTKFFDVTAPADFWTPGCRARAAFHEVTKGEFLARRPKPLKDLVESVGWRWEESLETPYELISLFAIAGKFAGVKKTAKSLSLAWRSRKITEPRKLPPKLVTLTYADARGRQFYIQAARRRFIDIKGTLAEGQRAFACFTTPFPVGGEETKYKYRKRKAFKINGVLFWTVRGLNMLASVRWQHNIKNPENGEVMHKEGEPKYPWAEAFRDWADIEESKLTLERFRELRYEAKYGERLLRYQKGRAKHIGPFTNQEDNTLREFFLLRAPGSHRIAKEEWNQILPLLPGRSQKSIIRRLEELGKQYAREHGWAAYCDSGLCVRRSHLRKQRWIKEGIAL
jgi:hypothetical protein